MSVISAAAAQVIQAQLQCIFSKPADTVATAEGQVQEVGVSVTGAVGHAQFVALLALSAATDTHLSAKRSGAGQRYFLTAEDAK